MGVLLDILVFVFKCVFFIAMFGCILHVIDINRGKKV